MASILHIFTNKKGVCIATLIIGMFATTVFLYPVGIQKTPTSYQEYMSTYLGLSFKYPESWYVTENVNRISVTPLSAHDPKRASGIAIASTFVIQKNPDIPPEQIENNAGDDREVESYSTYHISGKMLQYRDDYSGNTKYVFVFSSTDGMMYTASYVGETIYEKDFMNIMNSLEYLQ